MKKTVLAVFCGFLLVSGALAQQKLVGNIKGDMGGGCAFFLRFAGQPDSSPELMFYLSAGDEKETWMNIDGSDVRLKLVSRTKPTKTDEEGAETVGSRSVEKFAARNISVTITLTVSWVCAPDYPTCESMGYTAVFKVRKGRRSQTVRAEGVFGC